MTSAILKAGQATGEFGKEMAATSMRRVVVLLEVLYPHGIPNVEQIQDLVEEVLLTSPYKKTAKAYIVYREQHTRLRELTAKASIDLIDRYLDESDWKVRENSNMSYSLQGLNNFI